MASYQLCSISSVTIPYYEPRTPPRFYGAYSSQEEAESAMKAIVRKLDTTSIKHSLSESEIKSADPLLPGECQVLSVWKHKCTQEPNTSSSLFGKSTEYVPWRVSLDYASWYIWKNSPARDLESKYLVSTTVENNDDDFSDLVLVDETMLESKEKILGWVPTPGMEVDICWEKYWYIGVVVFRHKQNDGPYYIHFLNSPWEDDCYVEIEALAPAFTHVPFHLFLQPDGTSFNSTGWIGDSELIATSSADGPQVGEEVEAQSNIDDCWYLGIILERKTEEKDLYLIHWLNWSSECDQWLSLKCIAPLSTHIPSSSVWKDFRGDNINHWGYASTHSLVVAKEEFKNDHPISQPFTGLQVDARSPDNGKWYAAIILATNFKADQALIHYLGWSTQYDESLPRHCLALSGSYVPNKSIPPNLPLPISPPDFKGQFYVGLELEVHSEEDGWLLGIILRVQNESQYLIHFINSSEDSTTVSVTRLAPLGTHIPRLQPPKPLPVLEFGQDKNEEEEM